MGSRHASSFKSERISRPIWKRGETSLEICMTHDSMPRHIVSLLEANGGSTKYQGQNKQQLTLFQAKYWIIFVKP